jgi:hypothetical protein
VVLILGLCGASLSPLPAAGPLGVPVTGEPRVPGAKVLSAYGLLASEGSGQAFQRVTAGETVSTRDVLVVIPGMRAEFEPRPNSVRLTLWGNLPGMSDSPVLESSVVLHDSRAYDLDFSILRGRVVLKNTKKEGSARVWMRGSRTGVSLTLPEPGDEVAIEIYGRWPAGVSLSSKRKAGQEPVILWEVFVLKGSLEIKADKNTWTMSAPPGPCYFSGDSVHGPDERGPQRAAVPEWADTSRKPSAEEVLLKKVVENYREASKSRDAAETARAVLAMAEKDGNKYTASMARQLVVYAASAMDAVDRVLEALADPNPKHADMRKAAVVALRHWLGAVPNHDLILYRTMTDELRYSPREAETILQLLGSPFDRHQPETYQTLIAFLRDESLPIRVLAYWHLTRLAPAGRDISYDPAGPAEERAKGAAAWKKLIPSGELPPPPAKKPEK